MCSGHMGSGKGPEMVAIAGRLQQHVEALLTARVKHATDEIVTEARQTWHGLNPR